MRAVLRTIVGSIVLILPLAGAVPAQAQAQPAAQPPASSFQSTCRNMRVGSGYLFGECRRRNGLYDQTQIVLRGIENVNGHLEFTNLSQEGNFWRTCRRTRVEGAVLTAACQKSNGEFHVSAIVISGIANIDGTLTYP